MSSMITITVYICPICRFKSFNIFPIKHYEAGSAGTRTFSCPNCNTELDE